jgi:hypothetical protein
MRAMKLIVLYKLSIKEVMSNNYKKSSPGTAKNEGKVSTRTYSTSIKQQHNPLRTTNHFSLIPRFERIVIKSTFDTE